MSSSAELKARAGQAEQEAAAPATLRKLFEFYTADPEARGKGEDTIGRAVETAHVVERFMPELLDRPVSRIGEVEIFAFRKARVTDSTAALRLLERAARLREAGKREEAEAVERQPAARQPEGTKPSTINRDLRTLRVMLKRAVPGFRFPAGAFLQEDETRVRWLRPEEELLVFESMLSPLCEMARLAALRLMRLSEIRPFRREYVHLEQGVVLLPRANAGARPVILSGDQKILRGQLEAHTGELVFPNSGGRPYDRSYIGRVIRRTRGRLASGIFTKSTSGTMGPRWRSTRDTPRPSSWSSAAGRPSG